MKQQIYETYGLGNKFYPNKLKIDLHCVCGKPAGWWGSPVDAKYSWRDWCENEQWVPGGRSIEEYFSDDNKILWTLKEDTKILMINTPKDFETLRDNHYIILQGDEYPSYTFDFNKVLEDGYSAVQLNDGYIGHYFSRDIDHRLEILMNGWDCDSIVVLDPSKIIILEE